MKREPKYQEIVFAIEDYGWGDPVEKAREAMWKDISTQLQLLLKTGHNALVRADETDIIVLEYGYDEQIKEYGSDRLMWVTDEEAESIYDGREIIFTDGKKEYTADEDGTLYEETCFEVPEYEGDEKFDCDPDGFTSSNNDSSTLSPAEKIKNAFDSIKSADDVWNGPEKKRTLKVKSFKDTLATYPSIKMLK